MGVYIAAIIVLVFTTIISGGCYLLGRGRGKNECPMLVRDAYKKGGGQDDLPERELYPLATNDDIRGGEALIIMGVIMFILSFTYILTTAIQNTYGIGTF